MALKFTKSKIEKTGLAVFGIAGALLFILATKLLILGVDYSPHFTANTPVKAINLFWIVLTIFHIGLMFLIARSLLVGRTHYMRDAVVGFFAIVGVFFVIGSTIAGIYYPHQSVEWFFNFPQMGMFAIGFVTEALAGLYFAFTE